MAFSQSYPELQVAIMQLLIDFIRLFCYVAFSYSGIVHSDL